MAELFLLLNICWSSHIPDLKYEAYYQRCRASIESDHTMSEDTKYNVCTHVLKIRLHGLGLVENQDYHVDYEFKY